MDDPPARRGFWDTDTLQSVIGSRERGRGADPEELFGAASAEKLDVRTIPVSIGSGTRVARSGKPRSEEEEVFPFSCGGVLFCP